MKNADIIKKMNHKNINLGGNAHKDHKSCIEGENFIFSMDQNYKKIASVPIRRWNDMEPKSLSLEKFAKMLESAVCIEYKESLEKITELNILLIFL